jgi:hypothetical protein
VVVAQQKDHEDQDWEALSRKLKSLGVGQVVLVGPVPQWRPSLPAVVANRHWDDDAVAIVDTALDDDIMETNTLLKQASASELTLVPLIDSLCKADSCEARVAPSGDLLLVDYGHLSAAGSLYVVKKMVLPHLQLDPAPATLAISQ